MSEIYDIGASDISGMKEEDLLAALKKEKKTREKKPSNDLFGLINALFTDKEYVANLTAEAKRQLLFMVNRIVGIKYPLQARLFNVPKVNAADVIDFWSDFLYTGAKYGHNWIYTKITKKDAKNTEEKIPASLLKKYCAYYNYSMKDVETALKFFHDGMINDLKDFEKLNNYLEDEQKF